MNIEELKGKADQLKGKAEELQGKAQELLNNPDVQEKINQAKDFLGGAKDKLEDFVEDKTDGKGFFGFGKSDTPAK